MNAAPLALSGLPPRAAREGYTLGLGEIGTSALVRAYADGSPAALAFYRHTPWSPQGRAAAAAEAARRARHRDLVTDVMDEQNGAWETGPEALAQAARLREPGSVAVVTGQQLGLFAGPLYAVYKALTAVQLAARLERETGRAAVPVFWLADEDHDVAEVQRATFARGPDVRTVAYDDGLAPEANRGPVGRIVLAEAPLAAALAALERALPAGPFQSEALAAAREAYRPGVTMRDAFARLLARLTAGTGLVLFSADDARLKRAAAPLFAREITSWPETLEALRDVSGRLGRAGFHAQVQPRPVNLFLFHEPAGGAGVQRLPLDPAEGGAGFVLRGTSEAFTPEALLALLASEPERFSPNVVLRPLYQDTLLPTAAYVAGPGEAAYFAQLGPVYRAFNVPMPAVELRRSLTLVAGGTARTLARYGLGVPDLGGDLDALHRRLALARGPEGLDALFDGADAEASALVDGLAARLSAFDPELARSAEAARVGLVRVLGRLRVRAVRAQKRRHADIRAHLDRARAALWPGGVLQERALSPLDVVAREGLAFLPALLAGPDAPLEAGRTHDVLFL